MTADGPSCPGPRQEALHIFSDHVGFDVDRVSGLADSQGGHRGGVGDDADLETLVGAAVDRQADAVHGHRSLLDHVPGQRGGYGKGQNDGVALGPPAAQGAQAVHVTGHQVAVEPIGQAQCPLQVHPVAHRGLAEGREGQRFRGHVRVEPAGGQVHRRQAGAVDRDAVADPGAVQDEVGLDLDASARARRPDPPDGPQPLDDSGEHGPILHSLPGRGPGPPGIASPHPGTDDGLRGPSVYRGSG